MLQALSIVSEITSSLTLLYNVLYLHLPYHLIPYNLINTLIKFARMKLNIKRLAGSTHWRREKYSKTSAEETGVQLQQFSGKAPSRKFDFHPNPSPRELG